LTVFSCQFSVREEKLLREGRGESQNPKLPQNHPERKKRAFKAKLRHPADVA
jgi:hypothetical protein